MRVRARAFAAMTVLGLAVPALPAGAWAQAGWYATPSITLAEEFDDNVFVQSGNRQSDFITRISPGLKVGYASVPLTLLGSYGFDAEKFAEHPDLDGPMNRQRADLEFRYLPTVPLTLGFAASYLKTETPSELNQVSGIQTGRATATTIRASPSVAYTFDLLTSSRAGYTYTRSTVSDAATNTTHEGDLRLTRRLTDTDTGNVAYTLRVFESDTEDATGAQTTGDGEDRTVSHAVTLGWDHRFSLRTAVGLYGGPRFSEGTVSPEVGARFDHAWSQARITVAYARTQTTVAGDAGTVTTESLTALLSATPLRELTLSLGPSVSKSSSDTGSDTRVYGVTASATYQLLKWLSATAAYRFTRQEDGSTVVPHSVVTLGLTVIYPFRLY
jgi:hypothetical protein